VRAHLGEGHASTARHSLSHLVLASLEGHLPEAFAQEFCHQGMVVHDDLAMLHVVARARQNGLGDHNHSRVLEYRNDHATHDPHGVLVLVVRDQAVRAAVTSEAANRVSRVRYAQVCLLE
jgi:hypothetical protein